MDGRTRLKVCGLTRVEDLRAAVRVGADAVGLVFYAPSRRNVSLEAAHRLRREVPAFVTTTALFVNPEAAFVQSVLDQVGPDLLQFHGDESPAFCARFSRPYLKAFRVGAPGMAQPGSLAAEVAKYGEAAGWLFDSYSAAYGGSGQGFDLNLLKQIPRDDHHPPLILAGGLTAQTVVECIQQVHPFGVDVSSGVEVSPGIKDPARMTAFAQALRIADGHKG